LIRQRINKHAELFGEFMLEETREKTFLNFLLSISAAMAMGHLVNWQVLVLSVCLSVPLLYLGWLREGRKGGEKFNA